MDYLYENLGDERFQEFCSSLISKEFPNHQTFPVGQPDGGRDSIAYLLNSVTKEFIVFQVKYVRNANEERDIHKWLTNIIEGEIENINKLIPRGAVAYYLLTNVRGTAHLDSGSKDKVNKLLESKISIPALCWWREDLNTLFEKDPLFKWSFPQLLNGQDIFNGLLFNQINEYKERRQDVITSYLTDQYHRDNEVKFKQIDLKSGLFDLYTDVPIRVKKFNEKNKLYKATFSLIWKNSDFLIEDDLIIDETLKPGAAEFLLHPNVQKNIERVLLEGGPGQGKSTISQYISQVHRVRLLNKSSELGLIPEKFRNTPVRLPFKIDLRHVATWVEEKNPYQEILNEEYFKSNYSKSLESFLIGHIFNHSNIRDFNSNDLIAILKASSALFVFDGFDEIANIQMRAEVIDFINKGITRISSYAKSIQVIVTSRPAAFLDTIGFPVDTYPHFELTDINSKIINEYLDKWIKASDLEFQDAKEIRKLVNEKLEMPHLKDLAKTPMQLAILIALLRTKGQSLPNKRTSLYDNYIELFFDRESEKNALILNKRELIINIHQYLAWVLHSEAELYQNSGIIHIGDLRIKVKEYLLREGHDTRLADQLFDVMKERVCALVSRVQGTFEFEVQPLREYFCAKYLYKTAPHSDAGAIKKGTKPERFHAILRNFYWQNVVRFFAGCADRGELDMIIQELKDLLNDNHLKYTNYPRIVTSLILSDYVFTQTPYKLRDVVTIILDGINIGNIINQKTSERILLPVECGREEVIEECFERLKIFPNGDYANELLTIIANNPFETASRWKEYIDGLEDNKLTKWLEYGGRLKVINLLKDEEIKSFLNSKETEENYRRFRLLISSSCLHIINSDFDLKNCAFSGILNCDLVVYDEQYVRQSFRFLSMILNTYVLTFILKAQYVQNTFWNHIDSYFIRSENKKKEDSLNFEVNDLIDKKIFAFKQSIEHILAASVSEFKSNLSFWDSLVESGLHHFGSTCISFKLIAVIAAGISSKDEKFKGFEDLYNNDLSLCKRVRCSRLKSGNVTYWKKLFKEKTDVVYTLTVFLTWCTVKTVLLLIDEVHELVSSLSADEFNILIGSLNRTIRESFFTANQKKEVENAIEKLKNNDRIIYVISLRYEQYSGEKFLYDNYNHSAVEPDIEFLKLQYLIRSFMNDLNNANLLSEIKAKYALVGRYDGRSVNMRRTRIDGKLSYETAKLIMKDCKNYPTIISSMAEQTCRIYANSNLKPVGEIAVLEKWFEHE